MKTFTYTDFAGRTHTVEAHRVTFEASGHVAFWQRGGVGQNDRLILATDQADQVTEVVPDPGVASCSS